VRGRYEARLARIADKRAAAVRARQQAEAEGRACLRASVFVAVLLRRHLAPADQGAAFARVLQLGDEAAAALARIPDSAKSRRADRRVLAGGDTTAAAEMFASRLDHLVEHYRRDGAIDLAAASPIELLAWCLARSAGV
jgi:hypothetical protein